LKQLELAAEHLLSFGESQNKDSYGGYFLSRNNKTDFYKDWSYLFTTKRTPKRRPVKLLTEYKTPMDLFVNTIGELNIYVYPQRSKDLVTVKAISPDILWSLIPLNGKAPINRPVFLKYLEDKNIKNIRAISFP
jgi:hypothetical protein